MESVNQILRRELKTAGELRMARRMLYGMRDIATAENGLSKLCEGGGKNRKVEIDLEVLAALGIGETPAEGIRPATVAHVIDTLIKYGIVRSDAEGNYYLSTKGVNHTQRGRTNGSLVYLS